MFPRLHDYYKDIRIQNLPPLSLDVSMLSNEEGPEVPQKARGTRLGREQSTPNTGGEAVKRGLVP